jgi:catechol 2,3-dioxygenase-like lactoylglutathione lyase family enzyme
LPEPADPAPAADWFARPVLHVADVEAAVRFYVDRLGFETAWRHEDGGRLIVAQVGRGGCALILACTWADKAGKGTMFISLDVPPPEKENRTIALEALRAEFTAKGATVQDGQWGYRVLMVADPDGNTLLFNYTD